MTVISEAQAHEEAWIGVDWDGTLVTHGKWMGPTEFGEPIWPMVNRVKRWLSEGHKVKIFTARVSRDARLDPADLYDYAVYRSEVTGAIQKYLVERCELPPLPVVCEKDYACVEFWDDRAVQVLVNTGEMVGFSRRGLDSEEVPLAVRLLRDMYLIQNWKIHSPLPKGISTQVYESIRPAVEELLAGHYGNVESAMYAAKNEERQMPEIIKTIAPK